MAGIGEADRERVIEVLRREAAAGRLTPAELEDRVRRARAVTTHAGLDGVLLDLPLGAPDVPSPWAPPGADPEPGPDPFPVPVPVPVGAPDPGAGSGAAAARPARAPAVTAPGWPAPPRGPRGPGVDKWWRPIRTSRTRVAVALVLGAASLVLWVAGGTGDEAADRGPGSVGRSTLPTMVPTLPPTTDRVNPMPPVPQDPVLLRVGRGAGQLTPGLYTHSSVGDCHWERRDFEGRTTESRTAPRLLVEMKEYEQLFSQGCGSWHVYAAPDEPATSFGDGDWLIGSDMPAGRYRSSAPEEGGNCRWDVANGFLRYDFEVVDHGFAQGVTEAELPENHRFSSTGCGPWTLVP